MFNCKPHNGGERLGSRKANRKEQRSALQVRGTNDFKSQCRNRKECVGFGKKKRQMDIIEKNRNEKRAKLEL